MALKRKRQLKVAIIIGTRTKYNYLDLTLKNLYRNTDPSKFYLIGINQVPRGDPLTGEKTERVFKKYLRKQDIYIKNTPEKWVYEFWNQGIQKALKNKKTKYIGVFNDDIILPPRWLDVFLELFETNPQILYLFPAWTDGPKKLKKWKRLNKKAIKRPWRAEPRDLFGFCFMCPRRTFRKIGMFDRKFKIWGGDTDFFYRLLNKGYKSYCTPNVIIHHFYSRTLNARRRKEKKAIEEILLKDRRRKADKHHTDFEPVLPPLKP